MSLLLLYRPQDDTLLDADGDLGHRKKKRAKKKKELKLKPESKEEKERVRVKSFFVAVEDEQGKKRLIEQEIDDLLLFAMYLED